VKENAKARQDIPLSFAKIYMTFCGRIYGTKIFW